MRNNWFGSLVLVLVIAWARNATAQPGKMLPRVGFLIASSAVSQTPRLEAFKRGLRELGYVEGQNILLDIRSGEGKPEQVSVAAAELELPVKAERPAKQTQHRVA